jgi:hypothetical protein
MNTNFRSNKNHNSSYRHIFMLVALLLFLPFVQAEHNNQHDLLDFDFHCQICHSGIDIDGDNIAVSPKAFTPLDFYNPLLNTSPHLADDNNKASYTTRAPPQ